MKRSAFWDFIRPGQGLGYTVSCTFFSRAFNFVQDMGITYFTFTEFLKFCLEVQCWLWLEKFEVYWYPRAEGKIRGILISHYQGIGFPLPARTDLWGTWWIIAGILKLMLQSLFPCCHPPPTPGTQRGMKQLHLVTNTPTHWEKYVGIIPTFMAPVCTIFWRFNFHNSWPIFYVHMEWTVTRIIVHHCWKNDLHRWVGLWKVEWIRLTASHILQKYIYS